MTTQFVQTDEWTERPRSQPELSVVMLFGDYERWKMFGQARFEEMRAAGCIDEAVFVINREDKATVRAVAADVRESFKGFPLIVLSSSENNLPMSRNAGVATARGRSVLIWDDDDSCDPEALRYVFQNVFLPSKLAVMELPLAHGDNSPFHPQTPDKMPQMAFPGRSGLLVMGMVHAPFLAPKEVISRVPIPEFAALRGEWLHWSADLWRAGIPIVCYTGPVARESDRSRISGVTASSEANEFSTFHSLVSLLLLFCRYDIAPDSAECGIIRLRYFDKYCNVHTNETWQLLIRLGRSLATGDMSGCVNDGTGNGTAEILFRAYEYAANYIKARNGDGVFPKGVPQYDVMPFEMLNQNCRLRLLEVLSVLI